MFLGDLLKPVHLQCSDKSCLRTPSMKRRPTDSNTEGKKDTGMLKYIRNQVTTRLCCCFTREQ